MKWMPPTLKFKEHDEVHDWGTSIVSEVQLIFNEYYEEEIRPLFENAVQVTGCKDDMDIWHYAKGIFRDDHDTHKALLIKIEPLEEETAEDLLRQIIEARGENINNAKIAGGKLTYRGDLFEKAKAFLERKK